MKKILTLIVLFLSLAFSSNVAFAERSASEAVSWAEDQIGSNWDSQHERVWAYWCMHFCGHAYGVVPSGIEEAIDGWESNDGIFGIRHTDTNYSSIPAGALVTV